MSLDRVRQDLKLWVKKEAPICSINLNKRFSVCMYVCVYVCLNTVKVVILISLISNLVHYAILLNKFLGLVSLDRAR